MKLILLYALAVFIMLIGQGCATRNTGQCPSTYRSTELRNEGKVVLWCVP
jgi:hypothetical protein